MASPINSGFNISGANSVVIPTTRWARCCYTLQVDTGTVELKGTTQEFNRADSGATTFHTLDDAQGVALSAAAAGIYVIVGYALTGVEITAAAGATGRFMQQGETG